MRKLFLLLFLIFSVGCVANTVKIGDNLVVPYGYSSDKDTSREANKILLDFPNKVPGAKSVEKFLTPDATLCLIHIRQIHKRPGILNNERERVELVQKDIYKILSFLIENNKILDVCVEGICEASRINSILSVEYKLSIERLAEIKSLKLEIEMCEKTLKDKNFMKTFYPKKEEAEKYKEKMLERINLKKSELNDVQSQYDYYLSLKKRDIINGAALILAGEGKICILPAETIYGNDRAVEEIYNLVGKTKIPFYEASIFYILENRENIFLQMMSASKDPLVILVFGGVHAFGGEKSFGKYYYLKDRISLIDNLYYWNRSNPDKKISLIEIVPQNY